MQRHRHAPVYAEQVQALAEIRAGLATLDLEIVEAFAGAALARLRSPSRFPDPRFLAVANGIPIVRAPGLPWIAVCLAGVIRYRPCRDRRRQGFAVFHEIAEWLLERSGIPHSHADVQLLTLALALPRAEIEPVVRAIGQEQARGWVARRNLHAPAWSVSQRLEMLAELAGAVAA